MLEVSMKKKVELDWACLPTSSPRKSKSSFSLYPSHQHYLEHSLFVTRHPFILPLLVLHSAGIFRLLAKCFPFVPASVFQFPSLLSVSTPLRPHVAQDSQSTRLEIYKKRHLFSVTHKADLTQVLPCSNSAWEIKAIQGSNKHWRCHLFFAIVCSRRSIGCLFLTTPPFLHLLPNSTPTNQPTNPTACSPALPRLLIVTVYQASQHVYMFLSGQHSIVRQLSGPFSNYALACRTSKAREHRLFR